MARSQLGMTGRGESYWMFSVAEAACETSGMPHNKCLGGETLCKRLTWKPVNSHDQVRSWGTDWFVHERLHQRGAGPTFHPCAK